MDFPTQEQLDELYKQFPGLYRYEDFYTWKCKGCGVVGMENLVESGGFWTCDQCGFCTNRIVIAYEDPMENPDNRERFKRPKGITTVEKRKRGKDGKILKGIVVGSGGFRRYKKIFYYKERIAQWMCREPELVRGTEILARFMNALAAAKIERGDVTRGTVMQMCHELKLQKYKENWKRIMYKLREEDPPLPEWELVDKCTDLFRKIVKRFDLVNGIRGFDILKGSKGKIRHNMMHVNYLHRKIMEALGVTRWHREFPLLRTPSKIHILDDACKVVFEDAGIPFTRTAVIQIPRCRHRKKKCFVFS